MKIMKNTVIMQGEGGIAILEEGMEVPEELLETLDPNNYEDLDAQEGDYDSMKPKELAALCRERGLVTTGDKATLVARLIEDDSAAH